VTTVRIFCYRFAVSMLTSGSANVRNVLRGVACPHTRAMIDDRC